jgi:hypothetical protein
MVTSSRRAGTPNAPSTRAAAVETSDDRVTAIALFERWQHSPHQQYGDDRPPHMAVSIPILYRQSTDRHWHRARVLNLSETGVLFTPARLERGHPVEVILSPPASIARSRSANRCAWAKSCEQRTKALPPRASTSAASS